MTASKGESVDDPFPWNNRDGVMLQNHPGVDFIGGFDYSQDANFQPRQLQSKWSTNSQQFPFHLDPIDRGLQQDQQLMQQEQFQQQQQMQQNQFYQQQQQQMQQQQLQQQQPLYAENQQQQQFEQNVQNMFGIGQTSPEKLYDYDPFAAANTQDVNTHAFLVALSFNTFLFICLIGSYELFRRLFPSVYSPLKMIGNGPPQVGDRRLSGMSVSSNKNDNGSGATPAVNLNSRIPLGWIPGVARASWASVRNTGGLDSYMFLRYIRLCFRITFTSAVWGMIILWPVYATGDGGAKGWYFLSMANLTQGSGRLWVPIAFIWLQTFYVIFVMNEEYKHYLKCRFDFLTRGEGMVHGQQHMYSLLVERIPHELRSDRALFDYFNKLFPGKVHSTAVVLNLPDLERVSQKRKTVLRRLEKSMKSLEIRGRRPFHVVGRKRLRCCGVESLPVISSSGDKNGDDSADFSDLTPQRGERVDSINYYNRQLALINDKLARMQHEKIELAQKGDKSFRPSQMISSAIERVTDVAEMTLGGSTQNISSDEDDGLIGGFKTTRKRRKSLALKILDRIGIDFIHGGISYIQHNIDEVVDSVVGATMSSTGFVTFRDLSTVTCAAKTPLFHSADALICKMAPEPRDIIWENAHVNLSWSTGREWTANMLLGLGAILWSIPVASIQALATADQIANVPGMAWIETLNGGAVAGFVNGYLPVVLLLSLIMVLPMIFHVLALHYEDRKTQSDIQKSIIGRYFYYQLANIYITVTAGSVLDSLGEIVEHPSNILAILGKSLPTVVGYFLTFVS